MSYLFLFIMSVGAATILPFSSEVLVVSLLANAHQPFLIWAVATVGNTVGSCINALLGRYCMQWQTRRWFPFSPAGIHKGEAWFRRYGQWSLLIAWAPIVGDVLTLVAGMMRVRWWWFIVLVGVGKGVRYAVVVSITMGLI